MRSVSLIVDAPAAGAWNMAVDEALLEAAATSGSAALRLYQWNEPTLSLGYFQAASGRDRHLPSRTCPLVRRASGGGAIVHDRELTYSLALPDVRLQAATALYGACHETLAETLVELGVPAGLYRPAATSCASSDTDLSGEQPFLCFARRSCGDIVCDGSKIVGSAQRRRRGAVLQHGSILLDRSPCAPELPGIAQLAQTIDPNALADRWLPRLSRRLDLKFALRPLSSSEAAIADAMMHTRFATEVYTHRR